MPTLLRLFTAISLIWLSAATASAQDARMTPELLWKLGRLGEAAISSDGTRIAYSVRNFELEKNQGATTLYLLDWESGEQEVLLENWPGVGDLQFVGQGDQERLYFTGRPTEEIAKQSAKELKTSDSDSNSNNSNGKDSESKPVWPQIWTIELATGDRRQISQLDQPISNLKVSPTGRRVAFTLRVQLDPDTEEIFPDLPLADAKIIDGLLFRHWDRWHDGKYSHLHVAELDETGLVGTPTDLMPGIRADTPLPPFGGSRQIAWAPSGDEIAYTAKIVNNWAQSTNSSIFVCRLDEDEVTTRCITTGMEGYDVEPLYSPDQRWIAFHSMERAGFESDRNRILLYSRSTGEIQELTVGLDQTTHRATWLPDTSGMVFYSERLGTDQVFRIDLGRQGATQITSGQKNWSIIDVMPDGDHLLVSVQDMIRPTELALVSLADGEARRITGINDSLYEDLELPTVQERWVRSSDGAMVHCWVIYPPDFDPQRQWPLLTYCQGGPQGQIGQWFSYRWNFHLMAAQGYVVVAPNRRGLPGFGRAWNDQISGDWGGQAMQDILAATDEMLRQSYIDARRAAAVGASFGGYTVYWLMGHHQDRFRTMIAHCGVFNLESMYGSTEELFFVDWDMGGPYWRSAELQRKYDEFSPHRFVQNWKTPLLVIHGEKDFRVPITQGIEAFTAAQVQGVPSRFLYFPHEGHWVLTPQNGVLWHRVFFDWLGRYLDEAPVVRGTPE
jgi:dipeptidyl aminopeptidase/acylaminoacyl peptidase